MVIRATCSYGFHLVFTGDATKVSPKPRSDFRRDEILPLFGAENVMDVTTDVGDWPCRWFNSTVPTGLEKIGITKPGDKSPGYFHNVPSGDVCNFPMHWTGLPVQRLTPPAANEGEIQHQQVGEPARFAAKVAFFISKPDFPLN
jgi:hypothetical protein